MRVLEKNGNYDIRGREKFLDGKKIKTGVSSKSDIIEYFNCGLKGTDGKSEMGGSEVGR